MNLTLKNTHNGMLQDIYKHLHNTHILFHTITQYENTNLKSLFCAQKKGSLQKNLFRFSMTNLINKQLRIKG